MSNKRLKVIVTRRLPDAVELRLKELFPLAALLDVIATRRGSRSVDLEKMDGRTAYVFGQLDTTDGCFDANDVVVETGE